MFMMTLKIFRMGNLLEFLNTWFIKFIPRNTTRDTIGGWRPITLLRVSNKIIAQTLAMRLQKTTPRIVRPRIGDLFQICFIGWGLGLNLYEWFISFAQVFAFILVGDILYNRTHGQPLVSYLHFLAANAHGSYWRQPNHKVEFEALKFMVIENH